MKNIRLIGILITVAVLLLVPFIAMQIGVDGVKWTAIDFIAAAIMLLGAGLTIELVLRKVKTAPARIAFCGVILAGLVLIWGELATGFFAEKLTGRRPAERQNR